MAPETLDRWFGISGATGDPFLGWTGLAVAILLISAFVATFLLRRGGKISEERARELRDRTRTWCILVAAVGLMLVLGAFWTIFGFLLLAIFCYREFARLTGLFRNYLVSAAVVIGILATFFAVFDHWYGFFAAVPSLGVVAIASFAVLSDRPEGFLQRVALGVLAFVMFGVALGHVAYIANDPDFRSLLLYFLVLAELNDVFAYLAGNLFGKKKLAPKTSPNKTIGGAVGAVVGTTALAVALGTFVFEGTAMDSIGLLLGLGITISITGQLGDLVISSVKRDLGIKDTGRILPGHGGMLDRFDSLLLAGPAFFHYVGYVNGFGLEEPLRVLSGGG